MNCSCNEQAAANLRWYYRLSDGEMGLQSNFGSLVARLEGRGGTGQQTEIDGRRLEAAARARRISKALEKLDQVPRKALRAAFGGGEALDLVSVVLMLPEASEAHRRSRTSRPIREWLKKLCATADPVRRRMFLELSRAAEQMVDSALSRFASEEVRR